MEFSQYQEEARRTAIYPIIGGNIVYPALGLVGEAGEVAEEVKKIFRDDKGNITTERLRRIKAELGDILWYIANLATELDLDLDRLAYANLVKLQLRQKDGKLHGDGSNR